MATLLAPMCQFQKRLDTYDRPIGLTDAIRIMGCSAPRASQVPGESQLSVCTWSVDSGRTAGTRPIKRRSMAPGVGKTEAPATGLSKLNSMAFRLAVYASPDNPRTTQDSLPAAGQALPDGLSTRRTPTKGFRFAFYISSPFPKLAWRNPTRRCRINLIHGIAEILSRCNVRDTT